MCTLKWRWFYFVSSADVKRWLIQLTGSPSILLWGYRMKGSGTVFRCMQSVEKSVLGYGANVFIVWFCFGENARVQPSSKRKKRIQCMCAKLLQFLSFPVSAGSTKDRETSNFTGCSFYIRKSSNFCFLYPDVTLIPRNLTDNIFKDSTWTCLNLKYCRVAGFFSFRI